MADDSADTTPQPNGVDDLPQIAMIAQYAKDLSFENPNSPAVYQWTEQPQIDVQLNVSTSGIADDVFEVVLKIEIRATSGGQTAFAIELSYAGLFGIRNVPQEQIQPFLYAEAPRLMFPFARRVVADCTRDGNFPPLMLDPIDFGALYMQQAQQAQQLAQGETQGEA